MLTSKKNCIMKTNILKTTLAALALITFGCEVDDTALPKVTTTIMKEDFQTATNNTDLDIAGWVNYNEVGAWKWREKTYSGNGYAEFAPYGSPSPIHLAWLISPELDLDANPNSGIAFKVAQHHLVVDAEGNSLKVLISFDYDGTNVATATWTDITAQANIPTKSVAWYEFKSSKINLSNYSGKAHIAFKFKGSGTDTTLNGAFQVDDFIFFKQDN